MLSAIIKKIVGSKNERELKRLWPIVERIGAMEPEISRLTDEQLRNKTAEFKERLGRGETMVLDDACKVENDPDREARKALPVS